jgi:predicted CxxxxCH...CXXCH cytochrome family protein
MSLDNHPDHINNAAVIGDNFECAQCHDATLDPGDDQNITNRSVHANGTKNIQFNRDPEVIANWTSPDCSSVYCHSTGRTATDVPDVQLPFAEYGNSHYTQMTWGSSTDLKCNGCHGKSNSYGYPDYSQIGVAGDPDANTHQRHVEDKGINCSACHNDTTDDGKTIKAGSLHLNQSRNIAIAAAYDTNGGTGADNYNAGSKTCSAVSCHDAGSPSFTPVWGASVAGDCTDCHAFPPATGAHATHIQNASLLTTAYGNAEVVSNTGNYSFGCANCHPTDSALHQNNVVDIDLSPVSSASGPLKALNEAGANRTGSGNTSVCSQIYCHSNGGVDVASAVSPQWGGTFAGDRCAGCHENSPTGTATHAKHVVGIHYNSIYSGTTGNLTAGTGNNNSHGNSTYSTTINCDLCHNNTLDAGSRGYTASRNDNNAVCNTCHNGEGNAITSAHLDKSNHVSGAVDVQFDQTITIKSKAQVRVLDATVPELDNVWTRQAGYKVAGAYDQGAALNTGTMYDADAKTCAVTCHNNRSSTWGETNVDCFYCHSELPETP